ncbi:MAG TPA: ATP-binding protein [Bryobacteraceae bacterium]|nr:ATP-binding protein [Bryobacteraceae bacterium]
MKDAAPVVFVVLNVDDFEPGRYARTRLLQTAGYHVHEAATGADALKAVAAVRPSVVILDVNLPDMSGLEVCRRIKQDEQLGSTLVLQTSASAIAPIDLALGLQIGADAYLTEPVDPQVLLGTIAALLRISAAERQLQQTNEELRRSNEDLARFAYIASHDLQEPLRTITTYSQLLARRYRGQYGEEADQFVRFIVEGTSRMSELIRDLLLYSQVGAKREFQPVDLQDVLARTVTSLNAAIEDSRAEITNEPLPVLTADRDQMDHLFQNLISNAIKYRSSEAPRIHISSSAQGRDTWQLSVRDNGIGFPLRYADQIFEAFRRLDRTTTTGTGVGLAIAKRVVENHGGRIWADSVPGEGSTFHFTLVSQRL